MTMSTETMTLREAAIRWLIRPKGTVEAIKALVRPALTLGIVGTFLRLSTGDGEIPDSLEKAAFLVLTFWFVERAVRKAPPPE